MVNKELKIGSRVIHPDTKELTYITDMEWSEVYEEYYYEIEFGEIFLTSS